MHSSVRGGPIAPSEDLGGQQPSPPRGPGARRSYRPTLGRRPLSFSLSSGACGRAPARRAAAEAERARERERVAAAAAGAATFWRAAAASDNVLEQHVEVALVLEGVVPAPPRAGARQSASGAVGATAPTTRHCAPPPPPPRPPPPPPPPQPRLCAQHDDEGVIDVLQDLLFVLDVLHLLQPHHLRLLHDLQGEEAVGRVDDRANGWWGLLQCNAQVGRLTEAHASEGAGTC